MQIKNSIIRVPLFKGDYRGLTNQSAKPTKPPQEKGRDPRTIKMIIFWGCLAKGKKTNYDVAEIYNIFEKIN
ncbi:MAG: hypothetical protein ABIH21_05045, partial [Patescibacteria group bacterium]